jgi:hypothetical protein
VNTRLGRAMVGAVAGLVVLLAACGSESPELSDEASRSLQYQVEAVRQSAQSFDPAGVEQRLAELRAAVAQLNEEGEIDDARAAEILAAAADVEAEIDVVPTTTTAPPPPPPPTFADDDDDDDKGRGNGNGNGGGDD